MDSGDRIHNHCFLITQAQKIGLLQVVVSDEEACNRNGKPSNHPSLIPLTYCHYFYTQLVPSEELSKNFGHHGWPTKKNWLKRSKVVKISYLEFFLKLLFQACNFFIFVKRLNNFLKAAHCLSLVK